MRSLAVGCDASGKSTFIEAVHGRFGDVYAESTRSDLAVQFKEKYFGRAIDEEYVDARESLYLELSRCSLLHEQMLEEDGRNVITSDSGLVTRISHSVMREVRFGRSTSDDEVIGRWSEEEKMTIGTTPDIAVLTAPPFQVIVDRIKTRQAAGDCHEAFMGFNSLDFLEAYHARWNVVFPQLLEVIPRLLIIDTSIISVSESLEAYAESRKILQLQ